MHDIPLLKVVPQKSTFPQISTGSANGYAITWTHFTDTFMHINMV